MSVMPLNTTSGSAILHVEIMLQDRDRGREHGVAATSESRQRAYVRNRVFFLMMSCSSWLIH